LRAVCALVLTLHDTDGQFGDDTNGEYTPRLEGVFQQVFVGAGEAFEPKKLFIVGAPLDSAGVLILLVQMPLNVSNAKLDKVKGR